MRDLKKERERGELHRAIWAIADELRGNVDGWDFKNYVLGTMFYRYISENICNYINDFEREAGDTAFNYAEITDDKAEQIRGSLIQEKGFFILPSELFVNVLKKAPYDENLNETLERIFFNIESSALGTESERDFSGLFSDYDVNSLKLGSTVSKRNERLVKLLKGVAEMNLGEVKDHDIDTFGDAYEYLMNMYASDAGKSGGEFFTPPDVSELLTRLGTIGKKEISKVYDPACGSGSLLLQSAKILGKDNVRQGFYGQEINITTYNLCRINMFLHDVDYDKFDIACEDTLLSPQHLDDGPFELIVSNPPYNIKWAGDDNPLLINDPRFSPAGVLAPKSRADFSFIMHSLYCLAPDGVASIICFPGILYREGIEQKIRKYLIDNNFIDCIIQLPNKLFFSTAIPTCIVILKKNKKDNKTIFIDATDECVRVKTNNKLTSDNIERIVSLYANRKEKKNFSHIATFEEILANDYNLSTSYYVKKEEKKEVIDIDTLTSQVNKIVHEEEKLREEIKNISSINISNTTFKEVKVGDICEMCSRGSDYFKKEFFVGEHEGAMIIQPSNIENNKLNFENVKYYSWEGYYKKPDLNLEIGDVLLVKLATQYSPFKSAVVYELPEPAITNSSVHIFKKIKCNPSYLQLIISSSEFQQKMKAKQNNGVMNTIALTTIKNLTILLPPIKTQDKIVENLLEFREKNFVLNDYLNQEIKLRTQNIDQTLDSILWNK